MPHQSTRIAGMTWERDRIWCLGTKIDGCRYVSWEDDVSFADCDVLVVDARSLFRQRSLYAKLEKTKTLALEIHKRTSQNDFMLVCILSDDRFLTNSERAGDSSTVRYDNSDLTRNFEYFWHPNFSEIEMYKPGSGATRLKDGWKSTELAKFGEYLEKVKSYKVGMLTRFDENSVVATTKSGDQVACMYRRYNLGAVIVMLPPLQTPEESISAVLETLGLNPSTPEPEWCKLVDIPETRAIEDSIGLLKKQVAEENARIRALEEDLADRRSLAKLLYATGGELEGAVLAAFETLGLDAKPGEPGREDLVLAPSVDARCTCYVEVKGVVSKIKKDDLRQLAEWVDDGWSKDIKTKGILVANMHRLSDIRTSKDERGRLEPDQLEFAQDRKFCIVPAHLLFDLCVESAGGHATDPKKIERALIDTAGFVKPEDMGLEPQL